MNWDVPGPSHRTSDHSEKSTYTSWSLGRDVLEPTYSRRSLINNHAPCRDFDENNELPRPYLSMTAVHSSQQRAPEIHILLRSHYLVTVAKLYLTHAFLLEKCRHLRGSSKWWPILNEPQFAKNPPERCRTNSEKVAWGVERKLDLPLE